MKNVRHIATFAADELQEKRRGGESRTDWSEVRATTDEETEAAIASDPDDAGMVIDWASASVAVPDRKQTMTIRLDHDVLDFYRRMGRGYQTKINAILRSYMEHVES